MRGRKFVAGISISKFIQNLTPKEFDVSLGGNTIGVPSGWNEFVYNTPKTSFVDKTGETTNFSLSTAFWGGVGGDNVSTGNDSGAVPDLCMRDNLFSFGGGQVTLTELNPTKKYTIKIFATSTGSAQTSVFVITGKVVSSSQEIATCVGTNTSNTSSTVTFTGVFPTVDGQITIDVSRKSGSTLCFINTIQVFETPVTETTLNGTQAAYSYRYDVSGSKYTQEYYSYFPQNYSSKAKFPLIVTLAGNGEIGTGKTNLLLIGLCARINTGDNFSFINLTPYNNAFYGANAFPRWNPAQLKQLLDFCIANYKVDPNKIYLTGLSTGGNGCWRALVDSTVKSYFAASLIASGFTSDIKDVAYDTDLTLQASSVPDIPIKIFHNDGDPTVAVSNSINMVNAIATAQPSRVNTPDLTINVSNSHDAWTAMYNDDTIINWLLAQSK